jgi:hypothetical protein
LLELPLPAFFHPFEVSGLLAIDAALRGRTPPPDHVYQARLRQPARRS